jgi:pimeloyl-ACP methyl ester carboxylesterase
MLILEGLRAANPGLSLNGVVGPQALKLLPATGVAPLNDVADDLNKLPASELRPTNQHAFAKVRALLEASEPGRTKISQPVLLLQGGKDKIVPAFITQGLTQDMLLRGTKVVLKQYPKRDHMTVVEASTNAMMKWVKRQLPPRSR